MDPRIVTGVIAIEIKWVFHYCDVIMGRMASQIPRLTIIYSTIHSDADQGNIKAPRHWPLCRDSPHKWPVTRKMFPFDDVIMGARCHSNCTIEVTLFRQYNNISSLARSRRLFWIIYIYTCGTCTLRVKYHMGLHIRSTRNCLYNYGVIYLGQ